MATDTEQISIQGRSLIGSYRNNMPSRTGYVTQTTGGGGSSTGSGSQANLPPYLATIVLASGVLGGLLFVISVILFCKYCVSAEDSCVRRIKAFYDRRVTSTSDAGRRQHKYESLTLHCTKPVCDSVSQGGVDSLSVTASAATCRHYSSSSSNLSSSVKPSAAEHSLLPTAAEPDDVEDEIDVAIAQYKERLNADDNWNSAVNVAAAVEVSDNVDPRPGRALELSCNNSALGTVSNHSSSHPTTLVIDRSNAPAAGSSVSLTIPPNGGGSGNGLAAAILTPSRSSRTGISRLTGPVATAMRWASTGSEGAAGTSSSQGHSVTDRHVSFVLGSEKAGSFGGYGESSSSSYHRCTEGDYHHLKHTKIDRSPAAVAKQRSLGSLSGVVCQPFVGHQPISGLQSASIGSGAIRGQGNSVDFEQLKTGSENSVMIKSTTSTSVGSGGPLMRRESGSGNRTQPASGLSRISSGSNKLLRSTATGGRSLEIIGTNDQNAGEISSRTSSHVVAITSSANNPGSGGGKSFSSVGRSASSASATSTIKCRNTLDVNYGQPPEPRYDTSRRRQSMSLEIVPPTDKRLSPMSPRRVKSYDETAGDNIQGQGRDYDRNRITQFIQQPFSRSAAGDDEMTSAISQRSHSTTLKTSLADGHLVKTADGKPLGPNARQRNSLPVISIRYNDTGSFEEVDEEKVELLLAKSSLVTDDTVDTPGSSSGSVRQQAAAGSVYVQSRELWRLRASLAETEAFSDVIRMDDIASSPELVTSSLTTSFDSNDRTAGRLPEAAIARPLPLPTNPIQLVPGSNNSSRYVRSPAASLLLTGESRRQAYRRAIAQRWSAKNDPTLGHVSGNTGAPTVNNFVGPVTGNSVTVSGIPAQPETSFDSIDTMETDGDVSDTSCSRPEITTTSFDSTTTTDNDVDSQVVVSHRIQMQYDTGCKSVEPIHLAGTSRDDFATSTAASQHQVPSMSDRVHLASSSSSSKTTNGGGGSVSPSAMTSSTTFDRRSAKTASKKRRQFRSSAAERRLPVYESINELPNIPDGTSVNNDAIVSSGAIPPQVNLNDNNSMTSTAQLQPSRWLRYRLHGRSSTFSGQSGSAAGGGSNHRSHLHSTSSLRRRDYSVDKQTDAVFNEFLRYDPYLDVSSVNSWHPRHPRIVSFSPVGFGSSTVRRPIVRYLPTGGGGGGGNGDLEFTVRNVRNCGATAAAEYFTVGLSRSRRSPGTVAPLSPPLEEEDLSTGQPQSQSRGEVIGDANRFVTRRFSSFDVTTIDCCDSNNCNNTDAFNTLRNGPGSGSAVPIFRHHVTLVDGTAQQQQRLQYIDAERSGNT